MRPTQSGDRRWPDQLPAVTVRRDQSAHLPDLIEIDRVSQIFATRDGEPNWALWQVSLTVADGEFVCLIGPSGCGKTTLLHLIAGFILPSEGNPRFRGEAVRKPGPDRGVVFQEYALFAWMTARQNVEFGLRMRGLPRPNDASAPARRSRASRMARCARSGISIRTSCRAACAERVAVARALVNTQGLVDGRALCRGRCHYAGDIAGRFAAAVAGVGASRSSSSPEYRIQAAFLAHASWS